MKIIVTGGCGFIGSNFILNQLRSGKNKILNIDKLTYAGNPANLASIEKNPKYQFIQSDICDFKAINSSINNFSPESIVHFAAESHVDRSIDTPNDFIHTNIIGTLTLLECTRNFLIKNKPENFRFIHVSTDEVFGSLDKNGLFDEKTPYNPSSPYSASKASSDHLVRAWQKTYDIPSIITNCSNNYGPFQFPEKLIPLMIANCIDQKPLPIYGEGLNIRDWLHVDDLCRAIDKVISHGKTGQTYNIGGNNEITNIEIVNTICTILDEMKPRSNGQLYSELINYVPDRPGHDLRYAVDATKMKNELNWTPKQTFNSGIRKTISWYLKNENWWRKIQTENYNQERLGTNKQ